MLYAQHFLSDVHPALELFSAHLMADHPPRQIALGHALDLALLGHLAVAQYRKAVADGQNLAQLMRNKHDGHACLFHRAHHLKHALDLHLGQRSGGLVHDDDLRLEQQRARNLDDLLIGRIQRRQRRGRIQIHVQPFEHFPRLGDHGLFVQPQPLLQLAPQKQVLVDIQIVDQIQLLMDERDARVQRISGRGEGHRLAVHADFARVRLQHAAQNVHQRGLARAVFADQRADLAITDGKIHVPQHFVRTERFFDAEHTQ